VEKEAVIVLYFFEKVYRQNEKRGKRPQGQPAPQAVKGREKLKIPGNPNRSSQTSHSGFTQ